MSFSKSYVTKEKVRQRILIDDDWKFYKYDSLDEIDSLIYDVRPDVTEFNDSKDADSKPTESIGVESRQTVLKPWIMPTANSFVTKKYIRPEDNPGADFPFVQADFDDSAWTSVDLPHDWAINGPFYEGWNTLVGGGMGRLPSQGVAWYRKKLEIVKDDQEKSVFLDIDGAMSYAMVWINGTLVGGWPYGYNSWRVDLTPYLNYGGINQLAIRLDNPNYSARWYPGGGIYRNVWLVKTNKTHVSQYGTYITTTDVSKNSANVNVEVVVDNTSGNVSEIQLVTAIYELNKNGELSSKPVVKTLMQNLSFENGQSVKVKSTVKIKKPKLWGPPPTQQPHLYVAITSVLQNGKVIDDYKTRFGIRSVVFDPNKGVLVNGERIDIKGVNNHHDLGALGAAFNTRAAERQLEKLRDMGCNAIRMSHNPPAPELLELTDKMGFLVMDEIFDSWEQKKTPYDFHLIFPEWSEPDMRSFIRRDRNCPSVIMWSYGNEVGEQYTDKAGAAIGQRLCNIIKEEDPTRPTTASMNWAKSYMPFPEVMDVISLNYQGEGIRQDSIFKGTDRIQTPPSYDDFHKKFPDKVILSSETASTLSTRGTYLFPVAKETSSPVREGKGGDEKNGYVSAYELYAVDFGSSVDKVFAALDSHPFVAGEFVWTGWDYIGEPSPYYLSRSSYSGIIDLAGFPKDRYYLYQSKWRPDLPMVHILPHWNWPDRLGEITPIHIFTSGDEVELFLNGKSLGRKKKGEYEYRLRWDDVVYEPGEVKAVAYKNGKKWAEEIVKTSGEAARLQVTVDRNIIKADEKDLSFVTVCVCDSDGNPVRNADNVIEFHVEGSGSILATDNGDPTCFIPFNSPTRDAFGGLCLGIVKGEKNNPGEINIKVTSKGLERDSIVIVSK